MSSCEEDVMSACMQRMASTPRSNCKSIVSRCSISSHCESIASQSMCSIKSRSMRNERRRSITLDNCANNNYGGKKKMKKKVAVYQAI
mmetsp:Transcript_16284/g.25164  ORF Transcript_16284/g.25164 Transcript_16284/m.25164 type:complete len:88 (-) Transcript_16284:2420-2683(-)